MSTMLTRWSSGLLRLPSTRTTSFLVPHLPGVLDSSRSWVTVSDHPITYSVDFRVIIWTGLLFLTFRLHVKSLFHRSDKMGSYGRSSSFPIRTREYFFNVN